MATFLKRFARATGVSCTAIGVCHAAYGVRSVPGAVDANTTVDSRERFYGAMFAAYGLAWIAAARRSPVPAPAVRALAGAMALGGVGRAVSLADRGGPHWFQNVLTAVEFAVPAAFLALAGSDERAVAEGAGS
ncbi:DUF4345 domain-containing protein [Streptomyces sp. NPDC050560]|uniref:DUF4345 domain-containing protein n=1 Tax=Streptomyces sp. NPDC050560 TaxID=3365630 RepID=UPI003795A471